MTVPTPEEYWAKLSDWEKNLLGEPAGTFNRDVIKSILSYQASPRSCCGARNDTPPVAQRCVYGNCIEDLCVCGVQLGSGFGPVSCPCQDDLPTTPGVSDG